MSRDQVDTLDFSPLRARALRDRGERCAAITVDDEIRERFREATHRSRVTAVISALIVVVGLVLEFFVLEELSLPLAGVILLALLALVFALKGMSRGSQRTMYRVATFARRNGLDFQLWKDGSADYQALPFRSGTGHQRLAVVNAQRNGTPVEFGNLLSQATNGVVDRPCGYIAIALPERMPHVFADAGRLARLLGVRILPNQWHSSQRVDLPGARSFRLYAVDGASSIARVFFDPGMVALFNRITKRFDVEIKGRHLVLLSMIDVSSGSARRWEEQVGLVDELVSALNTSPVWDLLRRRARGRGLEYGEVRWAVAGPVIAVSVFAGVLFVGLLWAALAYAGYV